MSHEFNVLAVEYKANRSILVELNNKLENSIGATYSELQEEKMKLLLRQCQILTLLLNRHAGKSTS